MFTIFVLNIMYNMIEFCNSKEVSCINAVFFSVAVGKLLTSLRLFLSRLIISLQDLPHAWTNNIVMSCQSCYNDI